MGNISFYDSTGAYESSFQKPFSEKTAEQIDIQVSLIIETAYTKAKKILTEHREHLAKLAQQLLDKEVIFKEDLEEIFGKRPFKEEEKEKPKSHSMSENGSNGAAENISAEIKSDKPSEEETKHS